MKREPLQAKGMSPIEDEITMEYDPCNPDFYTAEDIRSAVEWLLERRVLTGKIIKNLNNEEWWVFKKKDFERAFEDVTKKETIIKKNLNVNQTILKH